MAFDIAPNPNKSSANQEITLEEVAELERPLQVIIDKIKDKIERGEYGIIIGEDASGRIPALILGNFIKGITKERKLKEPGTIFIPGNLKNNKAGISALFRNFSKKESLLVERLRKHVSNHGAEDGDRILVVTDTIRTGSSLKTLVSLLRELGYEYDLVSIGVQDSKPSDLVYQALRDQNLGKDSSIISGEYSRGVFNIPLIYKQSFLSGVRQEPGDLESKPIRQDYILPDIRLKAEVQIEKARKEGRILADKLISWYLAKDKAKSLK